MMKTIFLSACFFSIWLNAGCSRQNNVTDPGTGSETTNGITAIAVYENGSPAVSAKVFIRPTDFLADTAKAASERIPDAETDSQILKLKSLLLYHPYRNQCLHYSGRCHYVNPLRLKYNHHLFYCQEKFSHLSQNYQII